MKQKNKGFIVVGIIIAILIITGVGLYYWNQKSIGPESVSEPISSTDTSWKIYLDEMVGFKLKYPGDYVFRKIGSTVAFASVNNTPITLVGPGLGNVNVTDLTLSFSVLNIFGKEGNPEHAVFVKSNMFPAPELNYLNPDLAFKFKANRVKPVNSLPSGSYKGYVFQKNERIYLLYSLDTNTVLSEMVKTFIFPGNSNVSSPVTSAVSGCVKTITLQNRKDGASIPQKVTLGGKDYNIDSHIESEDNWASFSINGDIGPKGKYYNPLAPTVGNPLAVKGGSLPFPDSIVIQGVSIKFTKVGYTQSQQEFAEVCLNN